MKRCSGSGSYIRAPQTHHQLSRWEMKVLLLLLLVSSGGSYPCWDYASGCGGQPRVWGSWRPWWWLWAQQSRDRHCMHRQGGSPKAMLIHSFIRPMPILCSPNQHIRCIGVMNRADNRGLKWKSNFFISKTPYVFIFRVPTASATIVSVRKAMSTARAMGTREGVMVSEHKSAELFFYYMRTTSWKFHFTQSLNRDNYYQILRRINEYHTVSKWSRKQVLLFSYLLIL